MTTTVTIERTFEVQAPAARLWAITTDWSRHGEWFPLTRMETVGGDGRRVGGKFVGRTGIGPLAFADPITVTSWEEREDGSAFCAVVHTGRIIKGDAEISVDATDESHSTLRWVEHLQFGRAGALGWKIGGPVTVAVLDRALRKIVAAVEASSVG